MITDNLALRRANQVARGVQQVASGIHTPAESDASQVLLSLGDFLFTPSGLTYSQFRRDMEWRWAELARAGQPDLLQYTGKKRRTVTFDGEAYQHSGAGIEGIRQLEWEGDKEKPLLLINADGEVFGYWVILSLEENNDRVGPGGGARHSSFTLTVQHYANTLQNP